ncbi:hypothetical protein NPIL_299561 [Nephila pilipes]|uniref:Uncharacterized protein n=1 Tax=Nephila pilipes TaxID=299642 RepID=A0A8X6MUB1_NEPPI|nr:hypothetical protein NPIL_299561 [Nephila pilipes]
MESSTIILSFAKDALFYAWLKHQVVEELPESESTAGPKYDECLDNIKDVVWIESYYAMEKWKKFFRRHSDRITCSPTLYATYMIFACHLVSEQYTHGFECLVRSLALVTEFVVYSKSHVPPEFIHMSVDIFNALYRREIEVKFHKQGGLEKLKRFLAERDSLNYVKVVSDALEEGKKPYEILTILDIGEADSKMAGHRLKDIKQETVETHEETLELVETIADILASCQKDIAEPLIGDGDSAIEGKKDPGLGSEETAEEEKRDPLEKINKARLKLQDIISEIPVLKELIEIIMNSNLKTV